MTGPLYAVCRIVKAFGIKGEVVAERVADTSDSRLEKLGDVFIGPAEQGAVRGLIRTLDVDARGVRLRVDGVETRKDAEDLVGSYLFVDEDHREDPGPGRYHVESLVGMQVIDEESGPLGTIREVLKMPAQDLYVIDAGVMIPAVREFIRDIDPERRLMTVRLIEGLNPNDSI